MEKKFHIVRTSGLFNDTPITDGGYSSHMFFVMYDNEEKVGDCAISVHQNLTTERDKKQMYPDSWYIDEKSEETLPVLEVDGYSTIGSQGKGYGRLGYQEIYELSVKCGCGGRIITMPTFNAGNFYEKLGMETPKPLLEQLQEEKEKYGNVRKDYEKEGYKSEEIDDIILEMSGGYENDTLKYFDPTPENLAKLYKGSEDRIKFPNDERLLSESLPYKEYEPTISDNDFGLELVFDEDTGEFSAVNDKIDELKARLHKDVPSPSQSTGASLESETIKAYKKLKGLKK